MAYEHQRTSFVVGRGLSLASAADIGGYAPTFHSVVVRAVSLVVTNGDESGGTTSAIVVKFDKRPTAGSDTSRGDGDVATLTSSGNVAQGTGLYNDGLNIRVDPGEEVVCEVTDTGGANSAATVEIQLEVIWDIPENISDLTSG